MKWKAFWASALLSILFTIVYGATNALAAARDGVGSFYFEWERHIPFLPVFIVPYMSINLFFISSPFLCRTDRERRVLAGRIAFAIVVAGACFLLFPLRFGFERPHVDGWLGLVFKSFREFDQPFNELPSLHIAFIVILAAIYLRRFKGLIGSAIAVWFILIGFSAVLTYQHHLVDVVGGVVLAAASFHFFPDRVQQKTVVRNYRVGMYYAAGALVFVAGCFVARPWSWLLLWPALSFAIAAAGYFGLGPSIYRKQRGRLPATTWMLLWPVLLGQRASRWHYARQCRAWDVVSDRVWIGRALSEAEASEAIAAGVFAVLDMTGEFAETRVFRTRIYRQIPILDLTAPNDGQLEEGVRFVHRHARFGVVYVHCKIGYSRSAAVVGAYLMNAGIACDADAALAMLRASRPSIVIRPEIVELLRRYQDRAPVGAHPHSH
ncbi:MAG: dual specificity protein phosphatase family protein [Phycisphaerales bacterium]